MKKLSILLFIAVVVLSCKQNTKDKKVDSQLVRCDKLKVLDVSLQEPVPGDWLFEHAEKGQTFEQYIKFNPVSPDQQKSKIYLQPIGEFSEIQKQIIQYTADYLHIYFNLEVVISQTISDKIIPSNARRIREDSSEQLLTTYILDKILKKKIPDDGIVLMAITAKDLYPKPSWNFVFGQGSIKDRVGVSSIYRYSELPLDSSNYTICLERLIKTSSHEIGHMLSMLHCTNAVCVMNGSNGLYESDSRPNNLCSVCFKKLYWNIRFDIDKRFTLLKLYFDQHHLKRDADIMTANLKAINN